MMSKAARAIVFGLLGWSLMFGQAFAQDQSRDEHPDTGELDLYRTRFLGHRFALRRLA